MTRVVLTPRGRRAQRAAQTAADITIGLLVCALAAIVLVGWWT